MKHNKTLRLSIGTAFAILATTAGAQVVESSGNASVDVQPAMSIALVTSPSWGRVVKPAVGTARYKLNYSTGEVTLLNGNGFAFDDGQLGEYTVSGSPSAPLTFSVSFGAFSGTGVTVVESHINGVTDSGAGTIGIGGTFDLKVGGILDIVAGASVEIQQAVVTVTVDYP